VFDVIVMHIHSMILNCGLRIRKCVESATKLQLESYDIIDKNSIYVEICNHGI